MDVNYDPELLNELKGKTVLIKYGGNAMVVDRYKKQVIKEICELKKRGIAPVVVHGGGPAIKELLGDVGIESEFIGGHRKTGEKAMGYVEMALSGKVNSEIVKLIQNEGFKAVGISGKDGGLVTATKRIHRVEDCGGTRQVDLGHVGNVSKVDTGIVETHLNAGYIPVIAPIGVGEDLKDYNINADMFAGHLAGALKVRDYIVLTDVDGLMENKDDPGTLVRNLKTSAVKEEMGKIIQGGMIPKVESCMIALDKGAQYAHIINGMKAGTILKELFTSEGCGTKITRN